MKRHWLVQCFLQNSVSVYLTRVYCRRTSDRRTARGAHSSRAFRWRSRTIRHALGHVVKHPRSPDVEKTRLISFLSFGLLSTASCWLVQHFPTTSISLSTFSLLRAMTSVRGEECLTSWEKMIYYYYCHNYCITQYAVTTIVTQPNVLPLLKLDYILPLHCYITALYLSHTHSLSPCHLSYIASRTIAFAFLLFFWSSILITPIRSFDPRLGQLRGKFDLNYGPLFVSCPIPRFCLSFCRPEII